MQRVHKNVLQAEASPNNACTFSYDGSAEGLMTCVFYSYAHHIVPTTIQKSDLVQPRLGEHIIDVATNMDQTFRVQRGVLRCGGKQVWKKCLLTASSDNPDAGYADFRLLRELFDKTAARCKHCHTRDRCIYPCKENKGPSILDEWSNPNVTCALQIARSVENEINRMHELIRFKHLSGDIWFATCNPNADLVPFLMGWFQARFNTQKFIIWDEVHHTAGLSEGGKHQIVKIDTIDPFIPHKTSEDEVTMEEAWRKFYRVLSIDARYHPEIRRQFMPKRLWKNIVELQE